MSDEPQDYEFAAETMQILRFNTWGFLREPDRASYLWTEQLAAGEPIWAPPEAAAVPADQLGGWLAQEQARRIARARLMFFEPSAGDLAIQAGEMVAEGLPSAVRPPDEYGMLVCPNGLGYSADGMKIVAAAWSPLQVGYWITWWADLREWWEWAVTERGVNPAQFSQYVRELGNLHYITGGEYSWESRRDGDTGSGFLMTLDEHPAFPADTESPTLAGCFATTIGAWHLMSSKLIDLERVPPLEKFVEIERQYGLAAPRITRGFLRGTPDPADLWRHPN